MARYKGSAIKGESFEELNNLVGGIVLNNFIQMTAKIRDEEALKWPEWRRFFGQVTFRAINDLKVTDSNPKRTFMIQNCSERFEFCTETDHKE